MEKIEINLDRYKQKSKHPIHDIVDYYYSLKGLDTKNKEFWKYQTNSAFSYARNSRDAKILYELCNKDLYKSINLLYNENARSKKFSNYEWRISTVSKRLKNDSSLNTNKTAVS